jgi:hypothetical protein
VETKFRMFGQAVSKYMIVSVCVMLWRHSTSRWKGYFIRISMVFFVLKGGEYALRYLRYKQLSLKSSKCPLSIKIKELLKLYVNLLYRFCVTLFLEIFWLKIICCPPSWINFYLIGDFSDVISRVSHIKVHLNDQITLSLVWKDVRQFFISNSYWSIWFWAHNNQLLYR